MAELEFTIRANYESAILCREELKKVEGELQKLSSNDSPEKIQKLTRQYAELSAKWENHMSLVGKATAYTKEAIGNISKVLKDSVDEAKEMGAASKDTLSSLRQRLAFEEKVRDAIKAQREYTMEVRKRNEATLAKNMGMFNAERERLDSKYQGQPEAAYSKEDKAILDRGRKMIDNFQSAFADSDVKLQVFDSLLESSNNRTQALNKSLAELKEFNINNTSLTDANEQIKQGREEVAALKKDLDELNGKKASIEVEIKRSQEKIDRLTDVDLADQKIIENAARYNEQAEQTQRLTTEVEGLLKAESDLTAQEGLLQQEHDSLTAKLTESTARFNSLTAALDGVAEGTEEYAEISAKAENALMQSVGYENELNKIQQGLSGVREEYNEVVAKRIEMQKELSTSQEKEKNILAEHDRLQEWLNTGVEDNEELEKAIKNKNDANERLERNNEAIKRKNELLEEAQQRLSDSEGIVKKIDEVYKGFVESIDTKATKVFIDEGVFQRYNELKSTITDLQNEIRERVESGNFSVSEIEKLQSDLEGAQNEFRSLDRAASHTAEVLGDRLAQRVSTALERLYEMNANVRLAGENFAKNTVDLQRWKDELSKAESINDPAGAVHAREEIDKLQKKLDEAADSLSKYKAEQKDALKDVQDAAKQVENKDGGDIAGAAASQVKSLMGNIAAIAGVGYGLSEITDFFNQAKEWRTYFQDIESSMKVFLGSAEKGAEFTEKLQKYAYYNMFEFSDLAQASQQMISYGHDVDSIIPRLDQLSNVATGTHGSLMELVDTYNRAKATGVVDARGIQSWAVKGVMIKDTLREMGEVTTGTTVTFEQLNKVLDKITAEGGQFHNLMGEMMSNISAEAGQLEDNLSLMFNEIGEKYEGVFVKFLKIQSEIVDNRGSIISDEMLDFGVDAANKALDLFAEHWKEIISVIKGAVIAFGAYKAAMIAHSAYTSANAALDKLAARAIAAKAAASVEDTAATVGDTAATNANTAAKNVNAGANAKEAATKTADAAATTTDTAAKTANTAATGRLTLAVRGLTAAMLSNPYMLFATALAGIAYMCYQAYDGMMTQEKAQRMLNSAAESYSEKLKEQEQRDMTNIGIIQDKTQSLIAQTKAYRELIAEREIFAKFTKEEIANMSQEQIRQKEQEDNARKEEEGYRKRLEALEELRKRFAGKGSAWMYAEDSDIDEVVKEKGLGEDFATSLKESINGTTDLSDWANKQAEEASNELQKYLSQGAEDGVVEGFKNGFLNPEVQSKAQNVLNNYKKDMQDRTGAVQKEIDDTEKRIAELRQKNEDSRNGIKILDDKEIRSNIYDIQSLENKLKVLEERMSDAKAASSDAFKETLSKNLSEAQKRVEDLDKQLTHATGEKKVSIETEWRKAVDERDTWKSMMKLIEAGKVDTELVMKITRQVDNQALGDEKLVEIGKDYEKIDDIAQDVATRIEEVKKRYSDAQQNAKEHNETLKITFEQMMEDAGLTAESIDSDFSTATKHISDDIKKLKKEQKDTSDESKKHKIQLEIDRKQEQLKYIDSLRDKLKTIAKDPFNISVKIKSIIPDSLKKIFSKIFGIKFDEKDEKQSVSERAQQEGADANTRINESNKNQEEKKTGAQWKAEERRASQERKKELENLLKTQLTQKDAETYQKELDQINSALKRGAAAGRKILDQRAKRIADELKYRDEIEKIRRDAERSRIDAEIAAIEDDGERERRSRKEQHRRTLEDISLQQDDIYKKIYQQRKADYEQKNSESGLKYENTKAGALGWRGVKMEALPDMLNATAIDAAADKLRSIGFTNEQLQSIKNGTVDVQSLDAAIRKLETISLDSFGEVKDILSMPEKKTIEFTTETDEAKQEVKSLLGTLGLVGEEYDTTMRVSVDDTQLNILRRTAEKTVKYDILPGKVKEPQVDDKDVTRYITVKANTKAAEKTLDKLSDKVESMTRVSTKEVLVKVNDEQLEALKKEKGLSLSPIKADTKTTEVTEKTLTLNGFGKADIQGMKDGTIGLKSLAEAMNTLLTATDTKTLKDARTQLSGMFNGKVDTGDITTFIGKIKDAMAFIGNIPANKDFTLRYKTDGTIDTSVLENKTIEFAIDIDSEKAVNDIERINGIKTRPITYEATMDSDEVDQFLNNLPVKKNVVIQTVGDMPEVEDKTATVIMDTKKAVDDILALDDILIDTKNIPVMVSDDKAFEELSALQGISIKEKNFTVKADTEDALQALQTIEDIHYDPQTMTITADSDEALQQLRQVDGIHLTPKTVSVSADSRDALQQVNAINGITIDPKTLSVNANTDAAKEKLDGIINTKDKTVRILFDVDNPEDLKDIDVPIKPKRVQVLADNTQAIEQLQSVDGVTIDDKNFKVIATAQTEQAQQAVEALLAAFPDKKDRILEIIGKDTNVTTLLDRLKEVRAYLTGDLVKGAQESTRKILENSYNKKDIIQKIDLQFGGGNADIVARPMADAAKMVEKGWQDARDAVQSVSVMDNNGNEHTVLLSPILPDGTILSKKDFDSYVKDSLSSVDDILKADEKKIVIGVDMDKGAVDELRNLLTELFKNLDPSKVKEIQDMFDAIGSKNGLQGKEAELFGAKTAVSQGKEDKQNAERSRQLKEQIDKQIKALEDYQIKYGSFQEQRAATAEKYDRQIAETSDAIQKASLERQKEAALQNINMNELKAELNWEQVFGDLTLYSSDALEEMKKQLRNALDTKDITAENAKVLTDKILEIEDKISQKSNIWESLIPGLKERNRLIDQAIEAEKEYQRLLEKQGNAVNDMNAKGYKAEKSVKDLGVKNEFGVSYDFFELQQLSQADFEGLIEKLRGMGDAGNKAADDLMDFRTATTDATQATEESTKAKSSLDNLNKLISGSTGVGDFFKSASGGGGAMNYLSMGLQNGQSMKELVDTIGLHDTKFGEAVGTFSEGCAGFQKAISALMNGDIVGAVTGVIQGFQGFGKTIETAFGFNFNGGNEEEVRKEDERLIEANEKLTTSIELLTEEMAKQHGAELIKSAHDARRLQEEKNSNIMARFRNDMGYHSAHHSNAYYYDISPAAISQINSALEDYAKVNGKEIANSINGEWESLTYLTPEEMDYIRKWSSGAWGSIRSEGYYDWVYDALEEYADQAEKVSEITKKLYENLTQTTSDDIFTQLLESCINFANGADDAFDDVANNFQKMVNRMVISNFLGEDMKKDVEKWYNSVAELQDKYYGESSNDAKKEILKNNAQIAALQDQLKSNNWSMFNIDKYYDIVNEIKRLEAKNAELKKQAEQGGMSDEEYNREMEQAKNDYMTLKEKWQERSQELINKGMGGIGEVDASKGQQSATFNSAKNITYEQADSLVGIATAQQIILEQIKNWLYGQNFTSAEDISTEQADVIINAPKMEIPDGLDQSSISDAADKLLNAASNYGDDDALQMFRNSINRLLASIQEDKTVLPEVPSIDDNTLTGMVEMMRNVLTTTLPVSQNMPEVVHNEPTDILTIPVEQLLSVNMESRDIALDSRDILAGMAIHVEEIRDGVVDTIVPSIRDMRDDLNRVRRLVEEG